MTSPSPTSSGRIARRKVERMQTGEGTTVLGGRYEIVADLGEGENTTRLGAREVATGAPEAAVDSEPSLT